MAKHKRTQRQGRYNRQMSRMKGRGMTLSPSRPVGPRGAAVTQPPKSWPGICFNKSEGRAYKIGTTSWNEASFIRADGGGHSIIKIIGMTGTYRVVNCSPGMMSADRAAEPGRAERSPARGMTRRPDGGDPQPRGEEALPQYIKRYCYADGKLYHSAGYIDPQVGGSKAWRFPSQKQPGSVTVKKTMGSRVVVEIYNIHGKGGRIMIMVDKCHPGKLKG